MEMCYDTSYKYGTPRIRNVTPWITETYQLRGSIIRYQGCSRRIYGSTLLLLTERPDKPFPASFLGDLLIYAVKITRYVMSIGFATPPMSNRRQSFQSRQSFTLQFATADFIKHRSD